MMHFDQSLIIRLTFTDCASHICDTARLGHLYSNPHVLYFTPVLKAKKQMHMLQQ